MELASESVTEDKIEEVIDVMFNNAGLDKKKAITFKDFSNLLNEYKSEFNHASLSWEGNWTLV